MPRNNNQLTFAWVLMAFVVLGIAAWQVQVTVKKDAAAESAPLPAPPKTRHAIRPVDEVITVDPEQDYVARATKGITLKEIGWALEDFERSGLAIKRPGPAARPAEILEFRKKQGLWYLHCLTEGLHLDREQAASASGAMAKLFQEEYETRVKLARKEKEANPEQAPNQQGLLDEADRNWTESSIRDPFTINIPPSYFPWNLCRLTGSQEKVTWKQWYDLAPSSQHSANGIDAVRDRPELTHPEELAKKTGGPLFLLINPQGDVHGDGDSAASTFGWIANANHVLPLLESQGLEPMFIFKKGAEDERPSRFLQMIQRMHPAQFKTALLLEDGLAEVVRAELLRTGN